MDPTATASPVTLDQGVFLSSSLSFSPQVAGMIASFTVAWSLSGDLQAGESIKVHLPGFKLTPSTNEATMLLECDDSNGDDGYCSLFNGDAGGDGSSRGTLLWNVTTSMLEFTLDTSTAEGIVITGGTSVSVTLPLSSSSSTNQFDLQLPTSGLDTDDPSIVFFSFASASLATNGTSATSTDGISAGEISSSSLSFDPNYPGMLSDVLLSLTLTMDLEPGDEIRVYLPGFVSSSASSSTVSLSVTGDLSSRFDDASAVEWDTDNEFVALRLDSDANTITGHTAIILTIPASESSSAPYSLSTPVNGLFEDDISLSLAVTAQAGDVAHIGFDTSEVVCKFRDSELQFDPSFSGVAADITIIFTMTCSLALGELLFTYPNCDNYSAILILPCFCEPSLYALSLFHIIISHCEPCQSCHSAIHGCSLQHLLIFYLKLTCFTEQGRMLCWRCLILSSMVCLRE